MGGEVGAVSKSFNKLVDKIADTAGAVYEPTRIKRKAKAEAEASIIRTKADINIRAMERLEQEEVKKQQNFEKILGLTADHIEDDAEPSNINEDWLMNYMDKAKIISNEGVQETWAKLLAGEANKPGTFSKRTVNILHGLEPSDAKLFQNLANFKCALVLNSTEAIVRVIVYDYKDEIYQENGLYFKAILHLQSLGLITYNGLKYITVIEKGDIEKGENLVFRYHNGAEFLLKITAPENLEWGSVLLTDVGEELLTLTTPVVVDGFVNYLHQKYEKYL